jgi:hypothetical protein
MSWLRIDDGYDTHPKLLELTEQQRWRWTRVLIHCARHQTQGHVKPAVLRELGLRGTVAKLLQLGLLESNGDAGYLVHDWSTFNPKDPTKAERQARWRASHPPSTAPSTQASTGDVSVDDADDDLVDAKTSTRAQARARVPSRPVLKDPVTATQDAPREPDDGHGPGESELDQINKLLAQAAAQDFPT